MRPWPTMDGERAPVEACVTALEPAPARIVRADGFLMVDGLPIYEIHNFGIKIITMD